MSKLEQMETLPRGFLESLSELLPKEEIKDFLASFEGKRERSLSLNTNKIGTPDAKLVQALGLEDRVEWYPDSYYTKLELSELTSGPYYAAGLFYLQEASAASPAAFMELTEGMRVLDLSAAPGGKTLQIALALGRGGFLLSNDISVSRQRATLRNIEKFGLSNVAVSAEEPAKIAGLLPSTFDAILVDSPCSGEGMFAKDRAYIESWNEAAPQRFHDLQISILEDILPALKEGGYIMYSTCTFNETENEGTIAEFLKRQEDFCLEEISVSPSISEGRLQNTYRIWPHRARGLGHFFCKLRKRGPEEGEIRPQPARLSAGGRAAKQADEAAASLFQSLGADCLYAKLKESHYYDISSNKLYAVSKLAPDFKGLRLLRNSLFLADLTKSSPQPSQHLAMFMGRGDSSRVLSLDERSDSLRRYLLGETLLESFEEGLVLIALEDYPLGFAKSGGNKLKNLYKKDWIKCLRT